MKRISRRTERAIKRCTCGRSYTRKQWKALRLVGEHVDEAERAELRDCVCGSTISVGRVRVKVTYMIEPGGDGFLVFRRAGENGETIALGLGARAVVFPTAGVANAAIAMQVRADRAAASRLDVDLVEPANDNAKGGAS